MASQPPPTPTTITCLGDDLLREIFLRLPALPSLVRAAFACRAFRRSFRALHAPPLLALFLEHNFEVAPAFPCPWRRCDPDLAAADFFDIRQLSRHGDASAAGWEIRPQTPSCDGYLMLSKVSGITKQSAAYNPLTQALDLCLCQIDLQFYTLSSEDGRAPSRVVCVIHERGRAGAAVFSSDTMEWRIFSKNTLPLPLRDGAQTGSVMRGIIWWPNWNYDQIVVLDTATYQFSLIDLPTPLMIEWDNPTYKLGETKDEKLCFVDIQDDTLVSHFLTADDDSVVKRWVLYKEFPLHPIVKNVTGCSMEEEDCQGRVKVVAVIHGFVYLSIFYCKDTQPCELYLSLCLETSEMSELFKDAYWYKLDVHPYVMAWPPSLLQQSKEESETESTGDSVAEDGHVGTEKASSVLVAALQSLGQALTDDGGINKETVAELDGFLHPNEDDDGSLMSKISMFDAQLICARDRILRMRA